MKKRNYIEEALALDDIAIRRPLQNPLAAILILACPPSGKLRHKTRSFGNLARMLGVQDSIIYQWVYRGSIPYNRAIQVARISAENGTGISMDDLDPWLTINQKPRKPRRGPRPATRDAVREDPESEDLL